VTLRDLGCIDADIEARVLSVAVDRQQPSEKKTIV